MLHIEWNNLLIFFIFYFFLGMTFGVMIRPNNDKKYIVKLEDEIQELYSQQDALYEIIHDQDNRLQSAPIRQARG